MGSHSRTHSPPPPLPTRQVESLEKERDFYFGKLRDVEIMLQAYAGPDRATVDALFKILYAADDDAFVAPDVPLDTGDGAAARDE